MGSGCSTMVVPLKPCETPECCICLDDIDPDDMCTTNCGHTYHIDCIRSSLGHKGTCPMCRADILELTTPRTMAANVKQSERAERELAKAMRKQRKVACAAIAKGKAARKRARTTARAHMSREQMLGEIQRMRERGFRHGVDEDTARANYYRRERARRHRLHSY